MEGRAHAAEPYRKGPASGMCIGEGPILHQNPAMPSDPVAQVRKLLYRRLRVSVQHTIDPHAQEPPLSRPCMQPPAQTAPLPLPLSLMPLLFA
jgi:hypothetical protein